TVQPFLNFGPLKRCVHSFVQFVDDGPGCARGGESRLPGNHFIAGQTELIEWFDIRQGRVGLARGNGQRFEAARLNERHGGCQVVKQKIDLAGYERLQGRGTALVWHMQQLGAHHGAEQFSGQVLGGTDAGRANAQGFLFLLGRRYQVVNGIEGAVAANHQYVGQGAGKDDGFEVLDRVIPDIRIDAHVDGVGADGSANQGVAIRLCSCHRGRTQAASRTRAILHDDGLTQAVANVRAVDAADHVGHAARSEGHDVRNRALRPFVVGIGSSRRHDQAGSHYHERPTRHELAKRCHFLSLLYYRGESIQRGAGLTGGSVQLNVGGLDHFLPAGDFSLLEFGEFLRRVGYNLETQPVQLLGDVFLLQRLTQRGGKFVHDFIGSVSGNGKALPGIDHDVV